MAKTQKTNGNQPQIKSRFGIFQISGWIKKITIGVPEKDDGFGIEKEYTKTNICLQIGILNKEKEWENKKFYFGTRQLAELKQAILDAEEQLKELTGITALEKELDEGGEK